MVSTHRVTGGSKKGVYRLTLDDGLSVVGYSWTEGENYWPAVSRAPGYDPRTDPFSDASGGGLFETAHTLLTGLGVRVPELYYLSEDVALVEHVSGGTLEELLEAGAPGGDEAIAGLAGALELMYGCRADGFGKVGLTRTDGSCEQVVFDRAVEHLAEAAESMRRIAVARTQLDERLRELLGRIEERHSYRLIHGELYRLALSLSLTAGPMRLADSDYPERDFMIEIAEFNADRALGYA